MNRQDAEVAKNLEWDEPGEEHVAQTLSYLEATRLRLGLLNNFNVTTLRRGIQRVIHTPQDLGALGVLAVRPS